MFVIRKATRKKAKARIGIAGASGSGKTYSALLIAFGLAPEGKVGVIDTENASAELYAPEFEKYGGYYVITLSPPYDPRQYIEAIKTFERENFDVIIIDSLSHAWAGTGGLLDQHTQLLEAGQNSFMAWKEITPKYNKLVEAILLSSAHIIATFRAKAGYAIDTSEGKAKIIKVGMNPIQRDGIEYEFTTFFELTAEHLAKATKDRTGLFDQEVFVPTVETGQRIREYLESGVDPKEEIKKELSSASSLEELKSAWEKLAPQIARLSNQDRDELVELKNKLKENFTTKSKEEVYARSN
ncbi:MAG: AAA family ATPase [Dictyoglomus turgidum]